MTHSRLSPLFSWRAAICESGLDPYARLVALTLSMHMNERGGSAFPSRATLAHETGLHEKTVKDRLKALRDTGWLTASYCAGKSTRYTASVPEGFQSPAGGQTPPDIHNPGPPSTRAPGVPGPSQYPDPGPPSTRGGAPPGPPRTSVTRQEDEPPKPPKGGRPNPSCVWCEGTGWLIADDGTANRRCECERSPNRQRHPK